MWRREQGWQSGMGRSMRWQWARAVRWLSGGAGAGAVPAHGARQGQEAGGSGVAHGTAERTKHTCSVKWESSRRECSVSRSARQRHTSSRHASATVGRVGAMGGAGEQATGWAQEEATGRLGTMGTGRAGAAPTCALGRRVDLQRCLLLQAELQRALLQPLKGGTAGGQIADEQRRARRCRTPAAEGRAGGGRVGELRMTSQSAGAPAGMHEGRCKHSFNNTRRPPASHPRLHGTPVVPQSDASWQMCWRSSLPARSPTRLLQPCCPLPPLPPLPPWRLGPLPRSSSAIYTRPCYPPCRPASLWGAAASSARLLALRPALQLACTSLLAPCLAACSAAARTSARCGNGPPRRPHRWRRPLQRRRGGSGGAGRHGRPGGQAAALLTCPNPAQ